MKAQRSHGISLWTKSIQGFEVPFVDFRCSMERTVAVTGQHLAGFAVLNATSTEVTSFFGTRYPSRAYTGVGSTGEYDTNIKTLARILGLSVELSPGEEGIGPNHIRVIMGLKEGVRPDARVFPVGFARHLIEKGRSCDVTVNPVQIMSARPNRVDGRPLYVEPGVCVTAPRDELPVILTAAGRMRQYSFTVEDPARNEVYTVYPQ